MKLDKEAVEKVLHKLFSSSARLFNAIMMMATLHCKAQRENESNFQTEKEHENRDKTCLKDKLLQIKKKYLL